MSKQVKLTKEEALKSASIMLAIETDSAFKLYSFRIISHEAYVARIIELNKNFNKTLTLWSKKK